MSFDLIASIYQTLETLAFGSTLQGARVAFLERIQPPGRALIIGEGNGRFLADFVTQYPRCEVDCIDASARMIALAAARLRSVDSAAASAVRFSQVNLFDWKPGNSRYDLVVTHFLLDCFDAPQLAQAVEKIAATVASGGQWLLADFEIPPSGVAHYLGSALLEMMYRFFRATTGIHASRLIDPAPLLQSRGFGRDERLFFGGFVYSDLWRRR